MNSQNGTNGTPPSCSRAARVKYGMAYGARALGQRSFHSSQRTGKPSTRAQRSQRSPTAKGSRSPYGKDAKVREMRTAETILNIIQDRGKRGLPLDDVYRQLYNPDMFLRAYARLQRNKGAMTQGVTEETVDGMSQEKIARMIEAIRYERWRWSPVRRVDIPKSNGKTRPLGVPTWSDKLVQEVRRSILEAYYEPQFSEHAHGFRPHRGCHTALSEIKHTWLWTKWFVEGDIKGCFDSIDHNILATILRENIQDNRFLRLIEGLMKAGYCEEWTYHPSYSGTPQGGISTPPPKLQTFFSGLASPGYGSTRKTTCTRSGVTSTRLTKARIISRLLSQSESSKPTAILPANSSKRPTIRRISVCRAVTSMSSWRCSSSWMMRCRRRVIRGSNSCFSNNPSA